jgi:general secretion pathway protein G
MRNNQGFTLMEIMLVVVIIGILASIAAISIKGRKYHAQCNTALVQIAILDTAIDLFALDMDDYPDKLDDLVKATSSGKNWKGPYLKNKTAIPVDPWGGKYQYEKGSNGYTIFSVGKDGRADTADDIQPDKAIGSNDA